MLRTSDYNLIRSQIYSQPIYYLFDGYSRMTFFYLIQQYGQEYFLASVTQSEIELIYISIDKRTYDLVLMDDLLSKKSQECKQLGHLGLSLIGYMQSYFVGLCTILRPLKILCNDSPYGTQWDDETLVRVFLACDIPSGKN